MDDAPAWDVRLATVDDIEALVALRVAMMTEIDPHDGEGAESPALKALADANRAFMRNAIPAGDFVAYVAEGEDGIVATSGLTMYRTAPHAGNLGGVNAYILNMYTVPQWRGQGLASALLKRLVEHARACGATRVSLRATEAGRPVYERFGFAGDSHYMTVRIADDTSPE